MAAVDTFHVHVKGVGGHGAMPHETRDPVIAACGIAQAIQTIVSRNHYALEDLVVSVTQIHTGTVDNVIPETAYINGTVRTFAPHVQQMVMDRMEAIVKGQALSYGVEAELVYEIGYPATVNTPENTAFAADVAAEISGAHRVMAEAGREMGAEDFSYMLQVRPGSYLFLGQGDSGSTMYLIISGDARVHHGEVTLASICSGDVFGEMAFFTGERRTATVRASGSPLEVIEVDDAAMRSLLEHHESLADHLAEKMAERRLQGEELRDETGALISPAGLVAQFRKHLLRIIGR